MNIKEAKIQISNTLSSYFAKDEYGGWLIPLQAQRPIILMGPPGIGKTEIMAQIANELNVALVSYSLTHHTRQSVLGLPMIVDKEYGKVSEYTMSEIIASLYQTAAESKRDKGILFLDEINCVSETLMPTMLQFLQYKKIGRHVLPQGWLIVAAGNPQQYNRNARDFDVVTWDRLKRIDIEPDFPSWKSYMNEKGVHGSVLSYLDIKKENFYRFETTVDGDRFITGRGWDDLSESMMAYEKLGLTIDESLISQYIQYPEIAEDFYHYYQLYKKYEADYQIDTILNGTFSKAICLRSQQGSFDERYALISLILSALLQKIRLVNEDENYIRHLLNNLKQIKAGADGNELLMRENEKRDREMKMGLLTKAANKEYERVLLFLSKHLNDPFNTIKEEYDQALVVLNDNTMQIGKTMDNIFRFVEETFGTKEEMTILVSMMSADYTCAQFLLRHNNKQYSHYSEVLSLKERNLQLSKEIEDLNQANSK